MQAQVKEGGITGLFKNLTFQVLLGMFLGIVFGAIWPEWGVEMKFLGDGFIKLVKMVIAPIVFLTIVLGIAGVGDVKKVGKLGVRAIIYFEIVTTIAIILGMLAMNIFKPGEGMDISSIESVDVSSYVGKAAEAGKDHSAVDFLLNVIPNNVVGAFSSGDLLQVLFVSVMFGFALSALGEKAQPIEDFFERVLAVFFNIINIIMKVAPLGAFGALAFTIGKFGLDSLIPLGKLIFYAVATMLVFIFGVLGPIGIYYRINLWKFIKYIKEELLIVLGTSSSETVLPRLMEKLQRVGCSKSVVGLVVPTGYSFNLDGTSLYLAMCVLFIAQAFSIDLTLTQQISILGIMLLTSKGAAGVTGSGFVVLAATVAATGVLPLDGLALLLGIDRFMSTFRAVTNLIGNGFATMVLARIEGELDESMAIAEYRVVLQEPELQRI